MSLVYITRHNENIRDIEKQRTAEKHYKFPKYVSIHRRDVEDAPLNPVHKKGVQIVLPTHRYSHKTMGYAETPLDCPSNFLKKNGGVKWQRFNDHVCPQGRHLPSIPKKAETPKIESKRENFIQKNVKRIKTAVPFTRPPKYVDTSVGDTHDLEGTGLEPKYVLSEKFGKSPVYLKVFKSLFEKSDCHQMNKKVISHGITMLGECERNAILTGLRAKHLELEKTYQLLPIFTDTYAKRIRKGKLELELKRLEQDILLLESNPCILICDE